MTRAAVTPWTTPLRVALAVLLAFVALGAVGAGPAAAAGRAASAETLVIHVKSVLTGRSVKDVAPRNAFGKGDEVVMSDGLSNVLPQFGKPKGARIGVDVARVTYVREGVSRIVGITTFPDGTVRFEGTVSAAGSRVRVVGGTGRYAGATGTVAVRDLPRAGQAINVYTIRLAPRAISV